MHRQQVQTRGDQKQMAKTNSQKKASAETGPHKNEVKTDLTFYLYTFVGVFF